jgi:2-methylcitrate dehydratase PrpD
MDDVHNETQSHPGVAVIPAALAVAEELEGVSGRDLISAIVAGYEVMGRVGRAVMPDSYKYWHTTGTAGTFGAAAAAGKLLGLDHEQMVFCFGSAGTQAAGLFEFLRDGTNSKTLHAGKAAFNGVLSAELSKEGFTAAYKILEGEKGFLKAMSKELKPHLLTDNPGKTLVMDVNSFKPYACCRWCHPAIGAALKIFAEHRIDHIEVESIHIRTGDRALAVVDNKDPQTEYGCKFSIQYCVVAALLWGSVGIDDFTEKKMHDAIVRSLMSLCTTEGYSMKKTFIDDTTVKVVMRKGVTYSGKIKSPLGDPLNPMSFAEMETKFRSLISTICSEKLIRSSFEFADKLDSLKSISGALDFLQSFK